MQIKTFSDWKIVYSSILYIFIHSFQKCSLNIYYVPDSVLDIRDTTVKRTIISSFMELAF